jgi:flagellar hook protein FlgE
MTASLYNGVAGVKTYQHSMDIWGNNIANVNTAGYKQNLPEFHNLFSSTLNSTSSTISSDVGIGSSISSTAIDLKQGSLIDADSSFNMAIAGEGWFSVQGHNGNVDYTKDGRFSKDETGTLVNTEGNKLLLVNANNLVKQANGEYIFDTSIDTSSLISATPTLSPLQVPNNITFPAVATKNIAFTGNLDTSYIAKEVKPVSLTSDFNALYDYQKKDMNIKDGEDFIYTFGENISYQDKMIKNLTCIGDDELDGNDVNIDFTINGVNIKKTLPDGSKKDKIISAITDELDKNKISYDKTSDSITLKDADKLYITSNDKIFKNTSGARMTYKQKSSNENDFTTVGDLIKNIQNLADKVYPNTITVGLDDKGRIYSNNSSANTIFSNSFKSTITDDFMINISNLSKDIYAQTGSTSLVFNHAYNGYSTNIIDSDGNSNELKFQFIKTQVKTGETDWEGDFSLYDENNKLLSTTKQTFKFNENGVLLTPKSINIDNNGSPATIYFDKNGALTSQSKSSDSHSVSQDGFKSGYLDRYDVNEEGKIIATFSNGRAGIVGQIPLFHFQNNQGLDKLGRNLYSESSNSNKAQVFYDATKGYLAGAKILSNKIETSNVNFSQAMTEVIVNQKAFSASVKSITTSDQMLKTAINLKR